MFSSARQRNLQLSLVKNYYLFTLYVTGCDASEKRDLAIPLCLPDNWEWDPQRQECVKVAEIRSKLYENKEALEQLSQIKGTLLNTEIIEQKINEHIISSS